MIGLVLNVWLFIEDRKNNNSVLFNVAKGGTIIDLISTPNIETRKTITDNNEICDNSKGYLLDSSNRDNLK